MPPFPDRESALLNRLHRKHGDTEDKRTWIIGGKDVNKDREVDNFKTFEAARKAGASEATAAAVMDASRDGAVNGDDVDPINLIDPDDIMASLAGLDLTSSGSPTAASALLLPDIVPSAASLLPDAHTDVVAPPPEPSKAVVSTVPVITQLTHGTEKWFQKLSYATDGLVRPLITFHSSKR